MWQKHRSGSGVGGRSEPRRDGNLTGLPIRDPFDHCGGAELDKSGVAELTGGAARYVWATLEPGRSTA
ncbi:hypothetical protein [Streptomyces chartreusis]|uniref:hypothetical protein n=1 Tax=Streptomyces chartreusis TaxID=1969 RepID=UPI000262DAEC|nr:hypothetical protein [Streptomyces chartreusis]